MENQGIRLAGTAIIWFFSTAMMGFCIPLVAIAGKSSIILPLAVVAGATIGTIFVWGLPKGKRTNKLESGNTIKLLEQRIANLEVICSNNELDLHDKIKKLELKD